MWNLSLASLRMRYLSNVFCQDTIFKQFFLIFRRFCKERRSNRLFSEWVWLLAERYPGHFPAPRLSQLREFRTSSFFNCVVRKLTVDQNWGSVWWKKKIASKLKNELLRNCRNCDNREAGKWPGYLSASSQTHSEKSLLDFLFLRGNN